MHVNLFQNEGKIVNLKTKSKPKGRELTETNYQDHKNAKDLWRMMIKKKKIEEV
jgi:hypothetical protein